MIYTERLSCNAITGHSIWLARHVPSGRYGDPFTWTAVIVRQRFFSRTATIKGLSGEGFTRRSRQELNALLWQMGFRRARAQRHGRWRVYEVR